MIALPSHFSHYREETAAAPSFNQRKYCTKCLQSRGTLGGRLVPRPGSVRKNWICAGCFKDAAA